MLAGWLASWLVACLVCWLVWLVGWRGRVRVCVGGCACVCVGCLCCVCVWLFARACLYACVQVIAIFLLGGVCVCVFTRCSVVCLCARARVFFCSLLRLRFCICCVSLYARECLPAMCAHVLFCSTSKVGCLAAILILKMFQSKQEGTKARSATCIGCSCWQFKPVSFGRLGRHRLHIQEALGRVQGAQV